MKIYNYRRVIFISKFKFETDHKANTKQYPCMPVFCLAIFFLRFYIHLASATFDDVITGSDCI
jgi:hypothetical protein